MSKYHAIEAHHSKQEIVQLRIRSRVYGDREQRFEDVFQHGSEGGDFTAFSVQRVQSRHLNQPSDVLVHQPID